MPVTQSYRNQVTSSPSPSLYTDTFSTDSLNMTFFPILYIYICAHKFTYPVEFMIS